MMNLDEKQLKALHTRANFRRLLEYVNNAQVEKITKMCSKGFDPNFHCAETGGKFSAGDPPRGSSEPNPSGVRFSLTPTCLRRKG